MRICRRNRSKARKHLAVSEMSGSIYKITCTPTGKSYIGQTCDLKYKKDVPFNYGPTGRWSDHVSKARHSDSPLSIAIREHGRDNFQITTLEKGELNTLDELEAKWIAKENTLVPNGLNVAKHGRNKHHEYSTLSLYYKGKVVSGVLRPIRKNGINKLVYLVVQLQDGSKQRICFGQHADHAFEDAMNDAREFANTLECPITECFNNTFAQKYAKKLDQFNEATISTIRITTASSLIALYITAERDDVVSTTRVCFGGKTISQDDAYVNAKEFISLLTVPDDCTIIDQIQKSSQQATTV